MPTDQYDLNAPWNLGIRGTQVLPLINDDAPVLRGESGPGTGKTFGLVRRVVRILHPNGLNTPGGEVLVVAFNRVIAKDLRREISQGLSGVPHNGDPRIATVHALCLQVIGGNLRLLLEHEREAMLYDVLEESAALKLRFNTARSHDALQQALHNHEAKHVVDHEVWQSVERWLVRHKASLISQLPGLLLDSIHQGDYEGIQYRHVIVDEFQDLTPAEQRLFYKLRSPDGQFVALGDSRQSIYKFRGNEIEGLSKLNELAIESNDLVHDVALTECQRCPKTIVQAANSLMRLYPPPMLGGSEEADNTHVVTWKSFQAEATGMAQAIVENIHQNPTDKHLVMVSRKRFGYLLREKIHELDPELGVDLSFSESLLELWPVREAFLFVSLFIAPDPATWRSWLAYQNSTDGQNFKAARRNAAAYLNLLQTCGDDISEVKVFALLDQAHHFQGQGANKVVERLKRYRQLREMFAAPRSNAEEFLRQVFAPDKWVAPSQNAELATIDLGILVGRAIALAEEYTATHANSSVEDQIRFAIEQIRYQVATREPFTVSEGTDVQVTTLWGAKGVTADHVYLIGLCDEAIPGAMREEYPGTEEQYVEEQRRLLYVSLTRAKKTLVLSRSLSVSTGEARQIGLTVRPGQGGNRPRLYMCRFVQSIIEQLPQAIKGDEWMGCANRTI